MILESITVANDLILYYATPSRDGQELATLLAFLNLLVTNLFHLHLVVGLVGVI